MSVLNSFFQFLSTIPWFAWIPIAAIVAGAVVKVVRMNHRHQERMERIRHGMDPDGPYGAAGRREE